MRGAVLWCMLHAVLAGALKVPPASSVVSSETLGWSSGRPGFET